MESDLTRFNNQMVNLLNGLKQIDAFKNDKQIKIFEFKFNTIKSIDAKVPLTCFLKYVYPYKEQIMDKNELFFLGQVDNGLPDITNNIKEDIGDDKEIILHQALNIKNHWVNELTQADKDMIWQYFQVLVKLTERYVSKLLNNQ